MPSGRLRRPYTAFRFTAILAGAPVLNVAARIRYFVARVNCAGHMRPANRTALIRYFPHIFKADICAPAPRIAQWPCVCRKLCKNPGSLYSTPYHTDPCSAAVRRIPYYVCGVPHPLCGIPGAAPENTFRMQCFAPATAAGTPHSVLSRPQFKSPARILFLLHI